ncbi:MAG: hypothetical protein EOO71_03500 [Myxococcaceae bacterium]|nr:MAG: hypothetical protein EOO71_03500 [Myxococcaceae bacterium]
MADEKTSKDNDKDEDSGSPHAGVAFLGRLVDSTRISPLRPGALVREGGGVLSEWVHRFTAADCEEEATGNPDIKLPKELTYNPKAIGSEDRQETTLTSASEFTDKFAGSVSVEGSAFGVTCKASLDYKNFLEVTRSGERVMTFAQAVREDDEVELNDDFLDDRSVSPALLEAVKSLPHTTTLSADDKARCWRFIKRFGTHYIWSAVFGGRVFRQTVKTASAQSKDQSTEKSASASAGYSGAAGSASVSGKVEDEKGSKSSQAQSVFNSTSAWYGGKPKDTFNDWVQTVASDPQPLKLHLRRVSHLFDQKGFQEIENIEQKGKNLDACIDSYLSVNDAPRTDLSYLARQEFRLRNHGSDSSKTWSGNFLGVGAFNSKFATLKGQFGSFNTKNWRLEPAEEPDEFYLQADGQYLGPDLGSRKLLYLKPALERIPFRFVPVEGKPAEFYLRCSHYATRGDNLQGKWVVLDAEFLTLGDKDDLTKRLAWKLEPADLGALEQGHDPFDPFEVASMAQPVLKEPED